MMQPSLSSTIRNPEGLQIAHRRPSSNCFTKMFKSIKKSPIGVKITSIVKNQLFHIQNVWPHQSLQNSERRNAVVNLSDINVVSLRETITAVSESISQPEESTHTSEESTHTSRETDQSESSSSDGNSDSYPDEDFIKIQIGEKFLTLKRELFSKKIEIQDLNGIISINGSDQFSHQTRVFLRSYFKAKSTDDCLGCIWKPQFKIEIILNEFMDVVSTFMEAFNAQESQLWIKLLEDCKDYYVYKADLNEQDTLNASIDNAIEKLQIHISSIASQGEEYTEDAD